MKILTWNVNGIRSLPESLSKILDNLGADVCCFQETKITREMLTSDIALIENFNACFSFCRKRHGYSGVATYSKDRFAPVAAEDGLTNIFYKFDNNSTPIGCYPSDVTCSSHALSADRLKSLDGEGRVVITKHLIKSVDGDDTLLKNLHIINVYCPRVDPDKPERKQFKLDFYALLKLRIEEILKLSPGNHVIVAGDLNCSHKRIDHCDPDEDPDFDDNESRQFLTYFLYNAKDNKNGAMVDVFRQMYPNKESAFTCWCTKLSARENNYGTRIDYILMDRGLFESGVITSIRHCTEVLGSDHCPVLIDLHVDCKPSERLPDICTKFMPEFRGVQQKLTNFFVKRRISSEEIDSKNGNLYIKRTKVCQNFESVDVVANDNNNCAKQNSSIEVYENSASISADTPTPESSQTSDSSDSCKIQLKEQWKNIFKSSTSKPLPFSKVPESRISCSDCSTAESSQSLESCDSGKVHVKEQWKNIFKTSNAKAPVCSGHNEPCVLRTVKKPGPNLHKQFYCCARGLGRKDDANARCNFFKWFK